MHASLLLRFILAAVLLLLLGDVVHVSGANYNKDTAWYALHLCKAAHCDEDAVLQWDCGQACSIASINILYGFSYPYASTQGFVGVDHAKQQIVVAYRNLQDVNKFVTDMTFEKTVYRPDLCKDCTVHKEFHRSFEILWKEVVEYVERGMDRYPGYSALFTGHSLGGVYATLSAAEIVRKYPRETVRLYTFGSPRFGNAAFADYCESLLLRNGNEAYRVTNRRDTVPHVPSIPLGFKHVPSEVYYKSQKDEPVICDDVGKDEDTACSRSDTELLDNDNTHYLGTCTGCGNCHHGFFVDHDYEALLNLYIESERIAMEECTSPR